MPTLTAVPASTHTDTCPDCFENLARDYVHKVAHSSAEIPSLGELHQLHPDISDERLKELRTRILNLCLAERGTARFFAEDGTESSPDPDPLYRRGPVYPAYSNPGGALNRPEDDVLDGRGSGVFPERFLNSRRLRVAQSEGLGTAERIPRGDDGPEHREHRAQFFPVKPVEPDFTYCHARGGMVALDLPRTRRGRQEIRSEDYWFITATIVVLLGLAAACFLHSC